jgi:hypothetical protein
MARYFVSHMGILNDYLAYLPMVYNLSMAIAGTKMMNVPLDEADLAGIVLNAVPSSWVNQYNMMHSTLPKSPKALLNDLEAIKRVMDEKHQANLKQNPRKHQLVPELPSEVPRSVPPLEALVNCESQKRLSPESFASTARQMAASI